MVRESRRPASVGRCYLCGETFTKSSMRRHLMTCRERAGAARAAAPEGGEGRLRERNGLLLAVEGYGLPEYWLFLEVSPTATWADLDAYLRDTWVECCDHLSEFKCDGVSYISHPGGERDARSMAGRLVRVVQPAMKFRYRYDFGTTTELVLHALAAVAVAPRAPKVRLLARNEPPSGAPSAGALPPGFAPIVAGTDRGGFAMPALPSIHAARNSCFPWSTRRAWGCAAIPDQQGNSMRSDAAEADGSGGAASDECWFERIQRRRAGR